MPSIRRARGWFLVGLLAAGCGGSAELDLAKQVVEAEGHEASARRELVRLERELATTPGDQAALEKQVAAQRELVRAAEITARKLRIQSKQ